jgi:hypothetical protein
MLLSKGPHVISQVTMQIPEKETHESLTVENGSMFQNCREKTQPKSLLESGHALSADPYGLCVGILVPRVAALRVGGPFRGGA